MPHILMVAYTNYERDPRVRRQAEALCAAGHEVVFLARSPEQRFRRRRVAGVDLVEFPGVANDRSSARGYVLDYVVFFSFVFAHLLRRPRRYDLVHVNNMPDFLVFAALLPRLLGRPVIHDVHDLMPELYQEKFGARAAGTLLRLLRLQERWAARFASAVLTVEERVKDILATRTVPRDKIHVLMNLPDDRIFVGRKSTPTESADGTFVLVYHGTLARRLGLDVAIEAVALLSAELPRLRLRIIGAGEERERLLALRDALHLEDVVWFSEGFVPVEAIPALVGDAQVGLVPLRISDGTDIMLPTKLLEYVSLGIPCIVPRTGTIVRYFDETMVEFFDAGDPRSLARAIRTLHDDLARRTELAREATARFGEVYRWSDHKRVYVDLVTRLLARGGAASALLTPPGASEMAYDARSTSAGRPIPK